VEYQPSLCQQTMASETTEPYHRLDQNDKLRMPTYQSEIEPAIFIINSQFQTIQNTYKTKETSITHYTSCPACFEKVGNFGLK